MQWNTLLQVDRDAGGMAIRTQLKVEQTKAVAKDSPISFSKASFRLGAENLHSMLVIVTTEAPELLEKLTIAQLQAVHHAYCSEAEYAAVDAALRKARGVDKKKLLQAVVCSVRERRTAGFSRHDAAAFEKLAK